MESRETENTTAQKCSHLLLVRVLLEILGHVACCFQPQETERTIKDKERKTLMGISDKLHIFTVPS